MLPLREGKANVVYGVRAKAVNRVLSFHLGAKLLTYVANLLYSAGINEATCYKAFRRSLIPNIPLGCDGFEFCPEVTAKLCRRNESIWEVPISYKPRNKKQGKKVRLTDGWLAIWTLVRLRFVSRQCLFVPTGKPEPPPFPAAISHRC